MVAHLHRPAVFLLLCCCCYCYCHRDHDHYYFTLFILISSSSFHIFHLEQQQLVNTAVAISHWKLRSTEHKIKAHVFQVQIKPIKEFECCQIFCYSQLHVALFINDFTPTIQHNIYKEMLCCWICKCTISLRIFPSQFKCDGNLILL